MKELISCIKNLPKHFKTSLVNLWRNGAMTFSSIFAVTITLLLIGVISVLALNVQDISANIEEESGDFRKSPLPWQSCWNWNPYPVRRQNFWKDW